MRLLNFNDGYTSSAAPTGVFGAGATSLLPYANDAAFVAAKGSVATFGDIYGNTTFNTIHFYNGTVWESLVRWNVSSGNTSGAPLSIVAAVGVTVGSQLRQKQYIKGSAGPVTVSANPQIAAGTREGQELLLIGADNTNTVKLQDGTGLSMNGYIILGINWSILLNWDSTAAIWTEVARREN